MRLRMYRLNKRVYTQTHTNIHKYIKKEDIYLYTYIYSIQLMWLQTEKSESTCQETNICIKHQQSIYT